MVILLEELVFPLNGFVGNLSAAVSELSPTLFVGEVVEPVNFSLFLLHAV